MNPRRMLVCPCCHEFYSSQKDPFSLKCDECGSALQLVDYDLDVYSALSDEAKKDFKKKYIQEHFPNAQPYRKPFEPLPQSRWVSYIGCCGWLSLVGCLIGSALLLMSGDIIYSVVLTLAGALSCGSLILLSIVAEDVRHIRNQVDKLHHDHQNS